MTQPDKLMGEPMTATEVLKRIKERDNAVNKLCKDPLKKALFLLWAQDQIDRQWNADKQRYEALHG